MTRARLFLAVLTWLMLAAVGLSADAAPDVTTARGVVDKVEKDSITIRPRTPDGKFGKEVTLRVTGTTQVSTLSTRTQKGKVTLVQKGTSPRELQPKQAIAFIYAAGPDGPVLLSAVVEHTAEK
jgi:hypothetical protein